MARSLPSLIVTIALFTRFISATPLPQTSDSPLSPVSAACLALGLGLPFVLLALFKYAYLRYRRAQTIHTSPGRHNRRAGSFPTSVSENEKKSPLVGLGLDTSSVSAAGALRIPPELVSKPTTRSYPWPDLGLSSVSRRLARHQVKNLDLEGYLVGFLGSPAWETRIQTRRNKATRKNTAGLST